MRSERYQLVLILLGILTTALLGIFFYREFFPEYRIYQDDYIALEKFRSTYTGEPPPLFSAGVKQIVIEREDKGPPIIDRCISCHVALQIPQFSPTKIDHDINGNIVRDADGIPVQVPNEEYIWEKLNAKIEELEDAKVNEQLIANGESSKVSSRRQEADRLRALKTAQVGDHVYDVRKVLSMHPLMGKETRPFEYHPVEEYGCTSCHNGNGRGLTTEKAHGPVFDGEYEVEFMGPKPQFTEKDPQNDPIFSREFNHKPGHELLFQTSPILVGSLIEAKCMLCHQASGTALQEVMNTAGVLTARREKKSVSIKAAYTDEKEALLSLLALKKIVNQEGIQKAIVILEQKSKDYSLPQKELEQSASQLNFLTNAQSHLAEDQAQKKVAADLNKKILTIVGSPRLVEELEKGLPKGSDQSKFIDEFLANHDQDPDAKGSIFLKWEGFNLDKSLMRHVEDTEASFQKAVNDEKVISAISGDVDALTSHFHRGQQLYISQACYACHRIAGMARGGVGPELTRAGDSYPWFLKESIVWPQADLKTSTMPNYRLDHAELEDLMTFLLGQKGPSKAVSETAYKLAVQEWEAGNKMPWEKPIPPSKIHDLRYSMTVFATQGCAACHRLKGFVSDVGYSIEKGKTPDFKTLYQESQWFSNLFPEMIIGSDIVRVIEKHSDEIDKHIAGNVRTGSILEEIEKEYPQTVESLYSNFRYAARAKNDFYNRAAQAEKDPEKKAQILKELEMWKNRVHRVLMMYVQEYGLGRLIGPRPNWAGVYRSDEWLMEHFHNPASHVPRSIMPIMPFDESKFHALTYMLDVLGMRNRNAVHDIWANKGFNPELAYEIHCSQCHGVFMQGNGPIAEWIYPIPKNLRNAFFLRNLTKENAIQSIKHGVKGTPMPSWGETHHDKPVIDNIPVLDDEEIRSLVDWIFSFLPGGNVIKTSEDVPKWNYSPQDVLEELKNEGSELKPGKIEERHQSGDRSDNKPLEFGTFDKSVFPSADGYYAALNPKVILAANEGSSVQDVFEEKPNPIPGGEKFAYYIKKKYYTEENIHEGKQFFDLNCAVCHGAEADGSGIRAGVMEDAKPRMLTNLDWLNTRDDLRLLRSIKYGVPGTAMTPWGDQTSSLQRLQLVMYIRSLSDDKEANDQLSTAIYHAFDNALFQVERARIAEYPALDKLQTEYAEIKNQHDKLFDQIQQGIPSTKEALEIYKKELDVMEKIRQRQELDQILQDMKSLISREAEIDKSIGISIQAKSPDRETSWDDFLKIINLNGERFVFSNGSLAFKNEPEKEKEVAVLAENIVKAYDRVLDSLQHQKILIQGKIASSERAVELANLAAEISLYEKTKNKVIAGTEEAARIRKKEEALFQQYKKKLESLGEKKS